jgi:hypothetical protein
MGQAKQNRIALEQSSLKKINFLRTFIEENANKEIDAQSTDAWDLEIAVDQAKDELQYLESIYFRG